MDEGEKRNLYRRIVASVPEDMLLGRMRVYGYWPTGVPIPADPADEVAQRKEIEREIAKLQSAHSTAKDPDKALAEERKRRWDESKKRRAENKKKREAENKQRREAWDIYRKKTVVHAGEGVSSGLQDVLSDTDALVARGLPVMHCAADVAVMLGLPLPTLRWLTFHRRATALVHYHRFDIPKKTGGRRLISAPKATLKKAQQVVLDNILSRLPTEPEAHGFVAQHSIVTNAACHAGKAVVINVDLKDFFPSIGFRRVRGLFQRLGYSGQVATMLGLLCTEPPRIKAELDGKVFHVALGERVLPQGACTSPAITNTICRRLDRRLVGLASKHGFTYSRYADDLTFSGNVPKKAGRLLRSVRAILENEGFAENGKKTRVMRQSRRQEVTGLTVNDKPRVSREQRRELRAILHNAAKSGLESQNREGRSNFASYLRGRVAYLSMVEPERAALLKATLERALAKR
ncbi:MAG: hypothetical protein A2289_22680 [Deltaproteobacteria bacterium RIFOXYA12_FULL_58_15]|nr:MAG: hypothetical protein A2289_22680 [Deltaproteobacteria bacterium RIFOXYA12_FULL_58_15]OGR12778.1 MAG: hypothetical protein A2341_21835 [Deltaproteobacteria bacterium RIFOXYB12_FULL_58_9]